MGKSYLILLIVLWGNYFRAQPFDVNFHISNLVLDEQVESLDSIKIEITNQGFFSMGEVFSFPVKSENERSVVSGSLRLETDSSNVRIYFSKRGYLELAGIGNRLKTCVVDTFYIFPECNQYKAFSMVKTYHNDPQTDEDFVNYSARIESRFNPKEGTCDIPDTVSLLINNEKYKVALKEFYEDGYVLHGHGTTRKWLVGKKRYVYTDERLIWRSKYGRITFKEEERGSDTSK